MIDSIIEKVITFVSAIYFKMSDRFTTFYLVNGEVLMTKKEFKEIPDGVSYRKVEYKEFLSLLKDDKLELGDE